MKRLSLPILMALILVGGTLTAVVGTTQVVNQTTTVSGPCTGTATLSDGSPNGFTTTYTGSCAGTITYRSTATSVNASTTTSNTTSSTSLGNEMVQEVYNSTGLTHVPTMIVSWNSPAAPIGKDQWAMMWVVSDSIHGYTIIACVTSINGTHEFLVTVYKGSTMTSQSITPIPNESAIQPSMVNTHSPNANDFGNNEFTDFYLAPNGEYGSIVQFFWYGPHASFQAVDMSKELGFCLQSVCATGTEFIPTSEFVFFQPQGQPSLVFPTTFSIPMFIGQESQGRESIMSYTNATSAIDMTPVASSLLVGLSSNICEDNAIMTNPTVGQTSFPNDLGLGFTMDTD